MCVLCVSTVLPDTELLLSPVESSSVIVWALMLLLVLDVHPCIPTVVQLAMELCGPIAKLMAHWMMSMYGCLSAVYAAMLSRHCGQFYVTYTELNP